MAPMPGSFPANDVYPGPYHYTGDLPLGSWRMLANGRVFKLDINGLNGTELDAALSSGQLLDGRWKGVANASTLAEISFVRYLPDLPLKQRFHGFLLHYSDSDPLWRLVGTYHDANLDKPQAGWYATLPRTRR